MPNFAQWCADINHNPYGVEYVRGRKTGGKQYKVSVGEKLKVEQIPAQLDSQIELTEVLMIADGESVKLAHPLSKVQK